MGLYDYTLYSVFERNAKVYGNRDAWVCGEQRLTHKQYLEEVNKLAKGLLEQGIKKGDRIGVLAQNSIEYALLYGACAQTGTILLPVNWRLQAEEIEYIIGDATPAIMCAGEEFQEQVSALAEKNNLTGKCYAIGEAKSGFKSFSSLLENDGECPAIDVAATDDYLIIHTAAVGGHPRGATLSHQGLIVSNLQSTAYWHFSPDDCHLILLPLFHLAGLGMMLSVNHAGGKNVIMAKFEPDTVLNLIEQEKVSAFGTFPPILQTLLDLNEKLKRDISSLRALSGLEPPEVVKKYEELTGGTFWTAFGQTETSGFVTRAPYFERPGSAGTPSIAAEVEIMDEEGNILPSGQTGEIVVRGPMVFKGYWNLPEDNAHTFRFGWHHTGDKGKFDEDGYLFYMGRMPEKELIKPGGENVYPAEVEQTLCEHPLVKEASVIGVPDNKWGEAIKAICVLEVGAALDKVELIEFVASKIARYKKPHHVEYVEALPKLEDGEIDRDKVKAEHG